MLNSSLAAASLVGFLAAASCTLITDVDRTKIPTDAGAHAGETGTGGTGGTGGTTGGTSGDAGTGNEGGTGGSTGGTDQGGTGGSNAGTGGSNAGTGGTSNPTPACEHATGRITVGEGTFVSSGETFTISDGLGDPVTFEFSYQSAPVSAGNVAIDFDGEPTPAEFAVKIAAAVNGVTDFGVTATTTADVPSGNGNGGAGGEGGATGNSGATNGGVGNEGGATVAPPPSGTQTVELSNDRAGARGNVKIKETLGNPNFTVSGMSGGNAVQCGEDALCDSDGECESESCVDNICQIQ